MVKRPREVEGRGRNVFIIVKRKTKYVTGDGKLAREGLSKIWTPSVSTSKHVDINVALYHSVNTEKHFLKS